MDAYRSACMQLLRHKQGVLCVQAGDDSSDDDDDSSKEGRRTANGSSSDEDG